MSKNKKFPIRTLCQAALLIALEVVLNRFCSINTMALKIGLSFLPMVLCALLFGPWWAAGSYALADFIGAMLFPIGPYHPGFTVCAGLMGMVYGLFLYKKPESKKKAFLNILCATLINTLVLGLCVNTAWVAQLYGSKTYAGWFAYRLMEYAVLVPLHLILVPVMQKLADLLRSAGIAGNGRKIK